MCEPTVKAEVTRVATPTPSNVPPPRDVAPSKKVTVPVGAPAVAELAVAVNVTVWLRLDGFGEEVTVVVEVAGFTT